MTWHAPIAIDVTAPGHRPNERSGIPRHLRHRNEVQKCVRPKNRKHQPEQYPDDKNGVFHGWVLLIPCFPVNSRNSNLFPAFARNGLRRGRRVSGFDIRFSFDISQS